MHQGAKTGKVTKSGGASGSTGAAAYADVGEEAEQTTQDAEQTAKDAAEKKDQDATKDAAQAAKTAAHEAEQAAKEATKKEKDAAKAAAQAAKTAAKEASKKEKAAAKEAAQAAKTAAKAAAQAAKTAAKEAAQAAKRARRECTDDERRQYVEALVEKHRKLYTAMQNASADPRLPVADLENEDICIEVMDKDGAKDYAIFTSLTLEPELVCLEILPIYRRNIVELLTMSLGADGFFRCRVLDKSGIDFWLRVSARALRRWPAGLEASEKMKECRMVQAMMALDL